jgi:hypothetical protein
MWCDYSALNEEDMIDLLHQAVELGKTAGSRLNILSDFTKTPKSQQFNTDLKKFGKEYHKAGIRVKVAVLGIDSTLKRVIVNATMVITRINNVKLFEHKEEAMDWLVG